MSCEFSPEVQPHFNSIYAARMNGPGLGKTFETETHIDIQNDEILDGDRPFETIPEGSRETMKVKRVLAYMAGTSVFHGIGKIHRADNRLSKAFWLVLVLSAYVIMLIQMRGLFAEFFSRPVKTEVRLGFSPLALPAVTICNVNTLRFTQVGLLSCRTLMTLGLPFLEVNSCVEPAETNATTTYEEFEYYGACVGEDCLWEQNIDEGVDDYLKRRREIAAALKNESRENRIAAGHQIKDMLISCYLLDRKCTYLNFTHILSNDYGNCYTISSPRRRASRSGPQNGLELTLNLETEEFVSSYKAAYGLRVVVHEHSTRPFPSSEGFTVSAGTEAHIGLRLTQISRLGGVYGNCVEGESLKILTGYKYTMRHCREECLLTLIHNRCGCVKIMADHDDYHSHHLENATRPDLRPCGTKRGDAACVKATQDMYFDTHGMSCSCGTPCLEHVYESTITSRTWPILSYLETLEKEACRANANSPKCSERSYDVSLADRRTSFVKMVIYFERLNYESVTEKPSYDVERFLSDIGGTLGLWIGASVLGLGELVELVMLLIMRCRQMARRGYQA